MTSTTSNNNNRKPGHILIFLDIDGVLLPFPNKSEESTCGAIFPDDCLMALCQILEAFPISRIVLSSTWRAQQHLINDILDSFYKYGKAAAANAAAGDGTSRTISTGASILSSITEFASMTDPNYHTERQHEIYKYMAYDNEDKVAAWVALDDEELLEGEVNAKYRSYFEGHAVKVNSRIGLTKRDASIAIQLLQNQLEE